MVFTDNLGAARNVSARFMYFEASNGHRILCQNGGATNEKVLTVSQHALDDILDVVSSFVIVDETAVDHVVEWQGSILVTGWAG